MTRQRRYGTGSIYKYETKSGTRYRWQATIPEDPNSPGNSTRRLSQGGYKTPQEVDRALQDALRHAQEGKRPLPGGDLFGDYASAWLLKQTLANSTRMGYEKIIRVHLVPKLGSSKLEDIDARRIESLYRELERKGNRGRTSMGGPLSANTVNKIHIVLGSILQAALIEGKVKVNHARSNPGAVRAPSGRHIRMEQQELVTWTGKELVDFLSWNYSVMNDDLHALWRLLGMTGVRRGEGVALKWKDINFDNQTIAIRRASDSGLRKAVKSTKSYKSRSIAVDVDTLAVLLEHRMSRSILGPHAIQGEAFVFGNLDGSVRNPGDVGARWGRTVDLARQAIPDLNRLTLKGLRHTHATLLLAAGVNPKVVQERLGHSNITTTMNTYSHVTPTMQVEAIGQLARYIAR